MGRGGNLFSREPEASAPKTAASRHRRARLPAEEKKLRALRKIGAKTAYLQVGAAAHLVRHLATHRFSRRQTTSPSTSRRRKSVLIFFPDRCLRSACPFADSSPSAKLAAGAAARRRADRLRVESWKFARPPSSARYSSIDGTLVCRADWTAQPFIHSVRTYSPGSPADHFFSGRSGRQPDLRVSQADGAAAVLLFCDRTCRQICRQCIGFPHFNGGCYVYENSESLCLCRWTAVDHDGNSDTGHRCCDVRWRCALR